MAQSIVLVTGSRRGVRVDPSTLRVQARVPEAHPFPARPNKALLKTLEQLEDLWELPFEEVRGQVAHIVGDRMVEVLRELRENGREGATTPPQLTLEQLAGYFKENPELFKKLVGLVEPREVKVEAKVETKVEAKETKVETKETKVEPKVETKIMVEPTKVEAKPQASKARLSPIGMTRDRPSPLEKFIAQMTKVEPEVTQLAAEEATETPAEVLPVPVTSSNTTGFVDLAEFVIDSSETSGESSSFNDKFGSSAASAEAVHATQVKPDIATQPLAVPDQPPVLEPSPVITLAPPTAPIKILEPIPGTNKVKVSKLAHK